MSEILGTLFKYLVAILGVAAVVLILNKTFGANKVQNTIAQVTQTTANIQTLYNAQNNFTSLTNTVVIAGKLAPADMVSGTNLVNPWNGAVAFAVDANAAQYTMTQNGVPNDACAKLATGIPGAISVQINGGTVQNSATNPLDAGAATTACNSNADTNTLVFVFGR
jgi:hypothetical protein